MRNRKSGQNSRGEGKRCAHCGAIANEVRTSKGDKYSGEAVVKAYFCKECFHETLSNGTILQPLF